VKGAPALLLAVGLLQIAGEALRLPVLKGLGAATTASPAPKVFTALEGFEPFSCRFFLEWEDHAGTARSLALTSELYARVRGPYNRRNVYGAVLAAGPVLVSDPHLKPLFDEVGRYALCGDAPLLRELGIDPATVAGRVRVRYETRPGSLDGGLPRVLEAPCGDRQPGAGRP
jgi:hypothetical protein